MTTKPIVVAIISDVHAASTLGLCPPTFTLDDGGYYKASKGQRWVWRNWKLYVAKVQTTAEQHGAKIITVINGDVTEGVHHRTTQLTTANKALQVRMAFEVTEPLVQLSEQVYVIRGTESHTDPSGRLEESYADDIDAVKDDNRYSWWHLPLEVNGTLFDIAHHGNLGRLYHTKLNALGNISAGIRLSYYDSGQRPPDVVIRSHLHQYADTGDNYPTRVIATPGWQLKTAYIMRGSPHVIADIGGLIFVCYPGGKYDLDVVRFRPKRRRPVKVTV